MKFFRIVLPAALVLASCAGARTKAPRSDDPNQKLADARTLYQDKEDPAGAERLISDAIAAFKARRDKKGLADAYHQYAYLIESPAVEKQEAAYRRTGFLDKTVTFDNRLKKAIEYFDRAAPIYAELKRYDLLTNNSLGRGIVYANLRNRDEACASFDQALSFHEEFIRRNPQSHLAAPAGQESWDAYLDGLKKWAECSE